MTDVDDLWQMALKLSREGSPEEVFTPLGLRLDHPPARFDLFCTPLSSVTFASTGVDGVHFGLLQLGGELQPVVMTVPMNDVNNFIVAESLDEFLGLGYYVGWQPLDGIAYRPDEVESHLAQPDPELWPEEIELLRKLREELTLKYWPLSLRRIRELDERYGSALELP
jgi:hypothetical protein